MKRIYLIISVFVMCSIGVTASFVNINPVPQTAAETPVQPTERTSDYTYANKTISPYPLINSSLQKSAPSNTSLFEEMISLTTIEPEVWRDFSLSDFDVFMGVDGASQSRVLRVLVELYAPGDSIIKAENTTASNPLHILVPSPSIGTWRLHLKLIDTGNTTAWVQAISYNEGAKLVVDYQKERIHVYAGQTLYFKMPIEIGDWLSIYCVRLAGATVKYELHKPSEYHLDWKTKTNTFDAFYALSLPSAGVYLLVISNQGDADLMVQITLPNGVSGTLTPNERFVMKFALNYENEHFLVDVNRTFSWFALDGAVTNKSAWARFRLIDPDMIFVTDQTSDRIDKFVSKIMTDPIQGNYILILRASAQAQATVQLTTTGNEDDIITTSADEKITFTQSGQTLYYRVPTGSGMHFLYLATSLTSTKSQHRIFDFRITQISSRNSRGPNEPLYSTVAAVGGDYLVQVQSTIDSNVMIHFRFEGDVDYHLTTPDYTDFKSRFDGDIIFCKVAVGSSSHFTQYWHALGSSFIRFWVHNTAYEHLGGSYFDSGNDESRYTWTINDENFVLGNWTIVVTGRENGETRVSQLQTGDEERAVNTPFHVFEAFDFDYKAETFLVNIPECSWLSIVAQGQTDSRFYLRVFNSELEHKWDATEQYRRDFSHKHIQNPTIGNWLMIVDGYQSANLSLTFYTSADPMPNRPSGEHYNEKFTYYGEARHYQTYVANTSYLGLDTMWLTDRTTCIHLIDPEGELSYWRYSKRKFDVSHKLVFNPKKGIWYIVVHGSQESQIIYRMTTISDHVLSLPFKDNFSSDFDGKVTYLSFNVSTLDQLKINFTCNVDSDSWLWLHDPNGQERYQHQFDRRNEFRSKMISDPVEGRWLLVLVQEVFANLTMSCGGEIRPPPKPTGILIEFVYPPDAKVFVSNGNLTVLPTIEGIINAAVNVTDYYHPITTVRMYYNGGINYTNMAYNPTTEFYETLFNTTMFEDGLYELVAFAQCQAGEIGIASISILINNTGTFPVVDDNIPPIIGIPYQEPDEVTAWQEVIVFVNVTDKETGVSLVTLSISIDYGETWQNATMIRHSQNIFKRNIPGFVAGTNVVYMISACDYVGNCAAEDNSGDYYGFYVSTGSIVTSVALDSTTVRAEENISVTVHVTDGIVTMQDAFVELESDKGGTFAHHSGYTDTNGVFTATFTAPSVSVQTDVKITATASKSGYADGSDYKFLSVLPSGAPSLSITVTANPNVVQPEQTSIITVQVTDDTSQTSDASVALSSDDGDTLSPTSGYTNSSGYFTSTFTAPSVTEQTTITITAIASKTGYLDGQGQTQISVATAILSVSVAANPPTVQSGETSTITAQVTHNGNSVSGATVTVLSNSGGTFTKSSGTTNSNGYFTTAFAAPTANIQTTVTITAEATKTGYLDGQDQINITVNPSQPPPPEEGTPLWIYLIIIVVILSVIGVGIALARQQSHKLSEETISQTISSSLYSER